MRAALCHPDRPHVAHGLCRACYSRAWLRERRRERAATRLREDFCALCGDPFKTTDPRQRYCEPRCQEVACNLAKRRHAGEEVHVTRRRELASDLARAYVARGCRVVRRRTNGCGRLPFVAAWRNGPLYLIRARLPAEYAEEAA